MELFESHYWIITVFLQQYVGLWTFRERWKNYISWVYVYSFTISFSVSMGIRLYNEIGVDLGIVVENFCGQLYLLIVFFKITMTIVCRKRLKFLLSEIARDWREKFNDKEELAIMHDYTGQGRRSIMLYSGFMLVAVVTFLTFPILSPILDLIIPLDNGTRPKNLPYYAEYGIDIEEYYYPLLGQAVFGGVGTIVVLVSYDLCFILIVQHVIGLFALVNNRLSKAALISEKIEYGIVDFSTGDRLVYHRIIKATQLHKTVLEYIDLIENSYNLAWMVILMSNMLMLGGGLAVNVIKLNQPKEIFRYNLIMGTILVHFYYIFQSGQKIIDGGEAVFNACYACKWYVFSEKTKNLIKIMMIRSWRPCELTGGKMFTLSMGTYCNMMKTGLSLFTVVNSTT